MIELGHLFSKPYRDLIDSLEQKHPREGVRATDRTVSFFRAVFRPMISRYLAATITRVSGLVGGKSFMIFQPQCFSFGNNRIIWLHDTDRLLDGGQLEVEYTYRERAGADRLQPRQRRRHAGAGGGP